MSPDLGVTYPFRSMDQRESSSLSRLEKLDPRLQRVLIGIGCAATLMTIAAFDGIGEARATWNQMRGDQ